MTFQGSDFPTHGKRRVGRPTTLETGGGSLAAILSLIRTDVATTHLGLARASDLGRAVVSDRLATLERLHLIAKGEFGAPVGGRAPRHFRFRAEAGDLMAAHVGRDSIAVGLADLNGELIAEHHESVELAQGPEAVLDRLTTLFYLMLDERGGKSRAWGVSLALPEIALVYANEGDAFSAAPLDALHAWRRFDFATELATRFSAPCWVRSNTQMMTLGEAKVGAGRGANDILCISIDRSISAGVVSDGRLHAGAQGRAGLIGHAPKGEGGDLTCHCGARGCLDVVASGDAVARDANAAAREGRSRYLAEMLERRGEVSADDVSHGAQLGDRFCAELLAHAGRLVGESLAPLVNLMNPAIVVLAGSLGHSGEILLAAVREAIYRSAHPLATRDLRIVRSELGGSAELVGAARLASEEIFATANAREWIPHGSPRHQPSFEAYLAKAKAVRRKATPTNAVVSPPQSPAAR